MEEMQKTRETEETVSTKKGIMRVISIAAAVLMVALVGVCAYLFYQNHEMKSIVKKFETTFSGQYLYFNSITVSRFEEMVKSGDDFIVSIGRPTCGDCRNFDDTFIKVAEELDLTEKIYYVNVSRTQKDTDGWPEFKKAHGFFYTPAFVRYSGGTAKSLVECDEEDCVSGDEVREWLLEQMADMGRS